MFCRKCQHQMYLRKLGLERNEDRLRALVWYCEQCYHVELIAVKSGGD